MRFEQPYVVGLIGRSLKYKPLQKKFMVTFRRGKVPFVYLPFRVEPAYLKNIILCMRLMDVVGLNIVGEYTKKIMPYLDGLDPSAKAARRVNIIAKKANKFIGYYSSDLVATSIKLWHVK